MPCPHNEISIVQRSQRQSAVAAAAYQSGEKLFGSVKSFSQIGLQAWGKMKSVGNGGILNGSLQMLHIHVLFVTPLGTSHMA